MRIRQIAEVAGIDNGTLHYYFPSKEVLIRNVVDYLVRDLTINRSKQANSDDLTALDELRMEFEDIRRRLHESPGQFIVLSELAIRSWRDPEIAKVFKLLDDGWFAHLTALLTRGIDERLFRSDLNVALSAKAMMVGLRGIGNHSRLPPCEIDALVSELAAQTEGWIRAVPATESRPMS